jgi:hypothetical protein
MMNREPAKFEALSPFSLLKLIFWLVVSTPLKNICQMGVLFPIYGTIKNVPNQRPILGVYPKNKPSH